MQIAKVLIVEQPVRVSPIEIRGCAPNSYANRFVPEINGIILGFDLISGNQVTGKTVRPELASMVPEL